MLLPAAATAEVEIPLPPGFQRVIAHDESGELGYIVYVPPDAPPDQKLPVVLFLHGAGERGEVDLKPIRVGLGVALQQRSVPFIVVFPQCHDVEGRILTGWQSGSPDAVRALAILKHVEAKYQVDPQRRILCGWSMGGYGAWSLAAAAPRHWSAVLAVSGGAADDLSLESLAKAGTPVWAIHGSDDPLIPAKESSELSRQLTDLGGNSHVTILDGQGHGVWRTVFANPRVFDWMLDPASVDPDSLDWDQVKPLPARSEFDRKYLTRKRRIENALSVRLGNRGLAGISSAIPSAIPESALHGTLADIEREWGSGPDVMRIRLSQLHYNCRMASASLRAVSGGRFQVRFHLMPMELTMGKGHLESVRHRAEMKNLAIVIGHRRPVTLDVEVAPTVTAHGLRLIPLRQRFRIDNDNWYIRKPDQVSVESPSLTAGNMVTGIVGGLYLRREELESQVLQLVPSLLEVLERKLSEVPAPRLARMMWPLPALAPEVEVTPAGIRSDPDGLSLVLDMLVDVDRDGPDVRLAHPLGVKLMPGSKEMHFSLALEAMTGVSRFVIDDGMAHINVLDFPEGDFDSLTNPEVMKGVFPHLRTSPQPPRLRAVLRLLEPFSLVADDVPAPVTQEADQEPAGQFRHLSLALDVPAVGVDFWEQPAGESWTALGRMVISIRHPVEIRVASASAETPATGPAEESDSAADHREVESLTVLWGGGSTIRIERIEPLQGGLVKADAEQFGKLFSELWNNWTKRRPSRTVSTHTVLNGGADVQLQTIEIENGRLNVRLQIEPGDSRDERAEPAPPHPGAKFSSGRTGHH